MKILYFLPQVKAPVRRAALRAHRAALEASGEFEETRRQQRLRWMWSLIEERLLRTLRRDPAVRGTLTHLEARVVSGERSASAAAAEILAAFGRGT